MRLGLFGSHEDALVQHIARSARARGHEASVIDLASISTGTGAAFDGDGWFVDGDDVMSGDAYVLRSFPSPQSIPHLSDGESLGVQDWYRHALSRQEVSSFAQSCIMHAELRNKPVINPWRACSPFDHKPLQLAELATAGLPVPRTLVTNSAEAAQVFARNVPDAIVKPVAGGAEARPLVPSMLAHLGGQPVIFQERISGQDIRVTLVEGRVVSSVEIPTQELDYRSDASYQRGEQSYVPHDLPAEAVNLCRAAADVCHQVLSGVDLKRTPEGQYVILEANSAPMYLDIEIKTKAPITDAIIECLERRVRDRSRQD